MSVSTTYLSDNETRTDLLNNRAIAESIVKLLGEHPGRPVTIGVHGDWGAGKSSVLEMIEAELDGQDSVLCLKLNGWRFQGFEDAKIALIESIVTGLLEKRPTLTKASATVKEVIRRIDWLKIARRSGGLAFTALTGIPAPDQIQSIVSTLEGILNDPSKLATKDNIGSAIEVLKGTIKPPGESKSVPEEIAEFRRAFNDLLKEAKVDQLVALIDDLDRCLPHTTIEILEAVRLFVFTERTAFIIAADEAMIEYAVRKHFPELPETAETQTYARNYLEKLVQIPFRIPALGETETRIYVTLLLIGAVLGEEDLDFVKLIGAARKRLKRPWKSSPLDQATVNEVLGEKGSRANPALTLSDQIGPILAVGTRGNPRQIKRFLNALVLRQRTAEARGFGDDVRLPVLAKLMLAELFIPRLFGQIASVAAVAADGVCPDLGLLESAVQEPKKKPEPENKRKKAKTTRTPRDSGDSESGLLSEWLSAPAIRTWAVIQPPLAVIDLRPYLFVVKDRKDYFGAASVLGHLAALAQGLLGPRLSVQALGSELKSLTPGEAGQVFELVRGRVMGSGAFETQPPGIDGLTALVRTHPSLQTNLLDLLEGLPAASTGPWAVRGWEGTVNEPEAVKRLELLLENWGANADSSLLKAAASAALRTRKGTR